MSEKHLKDLRTALERKGWSILTEHPGNDYDTSGSWEIRRSLQKTSLYIDFSGLDDLKTLPLARSYGCHLRSHKETGLYFRRPGEKGTKRRQLWSKELSDFVARLEKL